jgi:peroxiredoxin/uncharacterized membrane protein YphA (DoxX/SURF4 family)
MEIVLLMARLFLASILVIAGVAKATDQTGARKALIGFGVSEKVAAPLGLCLPVVEIVVALALIPLDTAWVAAIGALALMLIFTMAIGISLLRGRTPECNCFGQLHSKPVSWSMFSRNLILAAVAALIVARGKGGPGLSAFNWLAELKTGEMMNLLVSSVAAGLLVTGVVYLRRVLGQQTRILDRIDAVEKLVEEYAPPPVEREEATHPPEGLPVGAPAPDFSLASVGGGQVSLRDLLGFGKPVLLLFVSPNCAPCTTILQDVKAWDRDYSDRLTIALLSKGSLRDNERRVAKYGARHLLLVGESEVTESYEGRWTPASVLISSQGRIASLNAYGDDAIRALIAGAVSAVFASPEDGNSASGNGHLVQVTVGRSTLKVGDPAPDFSLPDMYGEVVHARDLLGQVTLLLFWDPSCPFCRAMSEDVKRWEENPPPGAPRMVFVASGDLEKVKDASEGFESRFLHDDGFQVGMLLGTRSTPSALLIDSEGGIASSIATGSSNVMLLAGVRKVVVPVMSSSS